jgi:hypothetical protein
VLYYIALFVKKDCNKGVANGPLLTARQNQLATGHILCHARIGIVYGNRLTGLDRRRLGEFVLDNFAIGYCRSAHDPTAQGNLAAVNARVYQTTLTTIEVMFTNVNATRRLM